MLINTCTMIEFILPQLIVLDHLLIMLRLIQATTHSLTRTPPHPVLVWGT